MSPVRASSPINSYSFKQFAGICSDAAKTPIAIARSNRLPSLGISAGARFTVMRLAGNSQ